MPTVLIDPLASLDVLASGHLPSRRLPSPALRNRHLTQIIRVDPFKTADIETKLMRIGAASVMCVDPAVAAEKVLGHLLAKAVL